MWKNKNEGRKNRIHVISVRLILVVACAFLISFSFALWLVTKGSGALRTDLGNLIREELTREDRKICTDVVDAIYLLGGSPRSLELKFKTAATLYHDGICKRILILSRPGKTEYSRLLGRNLTNDEWAILKLEELGIPARNVEAIPIDKGFFGTLREAKGISRLIVERGYKSIILISSPYHTHRIKISFGKFLNNHDVTFYVQGSGERGALRPLLIELVKLIIYKYFLVS